jgi:hypothetical protein
MNNLSAQDIFDILSLLEHFSYLTINIHFTFDQNLHFWSKAFPDPILIIHESPDRIIFSLRIRHSHRNLEISNFLGIQRSDFNAGSHGYALGGVEMGIFRPLLIPSVYYGKGYVFESSGKDGDVAIGKIGEHSFVFY